MPARIRLKIGQYQKFAKLKWPNASDQARADAIGVHRISLGKVLKGQVAPGEQFIAGLLAAFPELEFKDLFEVVTDDEQGDDTAMNETEAKVS